MYYKSYSINLIIDSELHENLKNPKKYCDIIFQTKLTYKAIRIFHGGKTNNLFTSVRGY